MLRTKERTMKAFWSDFFFDIEECGMDKETAAIKGGNEIRDDLRRIEDAIRSHDGKNALAVIEELKGYY